MRITAILDDGQTYCLGIFPAYLDVRSWEDARRPALNALGVVSLHFQTL